MSQVLNEFMEAINQSSEKPVPTLTVRKGEIPDTYEERAVPMVKSEETNYLTAELAADKVANQENLLAKNMETVVQEGEQLLFFPEIGTKLPYYFSSYDELAMIVIGNIFQTEGLKSINISHFGSFLENTNPEGFSKVILGGYSFFVQDNSDRMIYIFDFLARAKKDLVVHRRFECRLVNQVEVNHKTAYTLVLTPKELMDIQKSYPTYQISYTTGKTIMDLTLVIQA